MRGLIKNIGPRIGRLTPRTNRYVNRASTKGTRCRSTSRRTSSDKFQTKHKMIDFEYRSKC